MARKTRSPKTYQTSPEFFALDSDVRYALVQASAGNDVELARDEYGIVTLARTDDGLTLVISWDLERNGYEVIAEPYRRS